MPTGVLNTLDKEQILDLLAYLLAGGNADDAAFQASPLMVSPCCSES